MSPGDGASVPDESTTVVSRRRTGARRSRRARRTHRPTRARSCGPSPTSARSASLDTTCPAKFPPPTSSCPMPPGRPAPPGTATAARSPRSLPVPRQLDRMWGEHPAPCGSVNSAILIVTFVAVAVVLIVHARRPARRRGRAGSRARPVGRSQLMQVEAPHRGDDHGGTAQLGIIVDDIDVQCIVSLSLRPAGRRTMVRHAEKKMLHAPTAIAEPRRRSCGRGSFQNFNEPPPVRRRTTD